MEVLNPLVELLVDLAVLVEVELVVMEPQEPQEPLILVVEVELLERHLPQVELVVLEVTMVLVVVLEVVETDIIVVQVLLVLELLDKEIVDNL